jgi:hypothetical protein
LKVIIAGSRGIKAEPGRVLLRMGIEDALSNGIEITEVVCGNSRSGMDKCAREWAKENSLPVMNCGADYDTNRAFGGYMRNCELVENGDALIAVTTGTAGTEHLIRTARAKGLPVFVISVTYEYPGEKAADGYSPATGRDLAHD